MRKLAETFPPGDFIEEEMKARGWTVADLASRMPGDYRTNYFIVEMILEIRDDKNLILDDHTSAALGVAFGVSPLCFARIDKMWRTGEAPEPNQP